jgi:hypothetical protein
MLARSLRLWLVLAALGGMLVAAARPSVPADVGAGLLCLACAVAVAATDGLRKRR